MLPTQSREGRIDANGIRAVRQAVLTGEQVQRSDVSAICAAALDGIRAINFVREIRAWHERLGDTPDPDDLDVVDLWESLGRLLRGARSLLARRSS